MFNSPYKAMDCKRALRSMNVDLGWQYCNQKFPSIKLLFLSCNMSSRAFYRVEASSPAGEAPLSRLREESGSMVVAPPSNSFLCTWEGAETGGWRWGRSGDRRPTAGDDKGRIKNRVHEVRFQIEKAELFDGTEEDDIFYKFLRSYT